ncbi:MAG: hypothetical protein PHS49_00735 [Candidatus Gracilibacteria bacterium]|nr:hypothetical protein [Candidatus Gracilibacteria bacterium]
MFKVISNNGNKVTVEMDIETYEEINNEIIEDINLYEFVFDEPIEVSKLVNNK